MASQLLEILFPGRCLLCGEGLLFNCRPFYPICRGCFDTLRPVTGTRCRICSRPLISETEICTRCRNRSYHFTDNFSLFEYRDSIREIIFQYKFQGRRRLGFLIADLFAPVLNTRYRGLRIIPVPSRPGSGRVRGWSPVEQICRTLERRHGVAVCRCLGRRRGRPQKSLNFEERLSNLSNRIRVNERALKSVLMCEAVLIDDIFTTGATADECARVLRKAGLETVRVLSFALD